MPYGCPPRMPPHRFSYEQIEDAMYRLMPGWFHKLDDLMDPHGPFADIHAVQAIADKNPAKPLDDIIHEQFQDEWFQYHADGDENW